MRKMVNRWWHGTLRPPEDHGHIVFINTRPYRHPTSRVAHALHDFWRKHWQWTIGTSLVIAGLIIAAKRL